jgi:phospholipase/lecithinase/hemolysin
MKKQILTTGVVLFSFLLPLKATAASFSQIYVFGDSLSDDGNVFNALGNTFPPPPYFQGRFSNGPIWVEQLAPLLELTPNSDTSFAFGGATTGTDNTLNTSFSSLPTTLPGLQQEINGFTAPLKTANQSADPNALYIVWAGANDYLPTISSFQPFTQPEQSVKNLSNAVTSLAEVGAKNIMVPNLGNLGELPLTAGSPLSEPLNALTEAHNSALAATTEDLRQQLGSEVNIIPFDVNSLFNNITKEPEKFGFTNVTDSCLNQNTGNVCANPDEYLFWDRQHPTTATHTLLAESASATLASVPEPSYELGTLAFGACSVFLVLKRKQKKVSSRKAEL